MGGTWGLVAALGVAAAFTLRALQVRAARRRLAEELLRPAAEGMGLFMHGSSFRGQYMGHAVRGDGVGHVERTRPSWSEAVRGLLAAPSRALRLRVELTAPGLSAPSPARSVAEVRKDLRGRGLDRELFEVTSQGTELVVVLRREAADPALAGGLAVKAIEAATGRPG